MSGTVEEYVDKIGRISSEYKQLSRSEVEFNDDGESSPEEIKERKISIYKYIKRKAIKCEDERIAVATLEFTPKMFKYLPKKFKHDKQFFIECVNTLESPKLLKYADEVIRADLDCCLVALNWDYRLYDFVSNKIKENPEIVELYEWKKEVLNLPNNLPEIDLEKWGPDSDDKYFYNNEKNLSLKDESTNENMQETLSHLEEEKSNLDFPDISTISNGNGKSSQNTRITKSGRVTKSSKKITQSANLVAGNEIYTEATLDWETDGEIDEDDGSIDNQKIDDDDPELPPIKKKEKKGFIAKLFKK